MGFRITTNMMMNTYRYNLQNSTKKLSDARDMVLTQRRFGSYAEDPAAATLAFRLRRDYLQTSSYLSNTKEVYSKYSTAWNNLAGVIHDLSDRTARMASIRGVDGTSGESRRALAAVLRQTAESVVQAMNQKMGDHFIFGGNDALNPPFSWSGDRLLYRGVDVSSHPMKEPVYNRPGWMDEKDCFDAYGYPIEDKIKEWRDAQRKETGYDDPYDDFKGDLTKADEAWIDYCYGNRAYERLQEMSGEEMYIDLGMGAAERSPNSPIKGTYFNSALCGIDFIGYGVDEDGDPKNLAMIMKNLADIFETWDESMDPQGYNPNLAKGSAQGLGQDELEKRAERLMDKLKAAQENTTEKYTELNANSVYLQSNENLLVTQQTDLNIQILDLEQVDLAEAITSFSWEQYCYNAALKIGNQLLTQSLIDYMN